MCPDTPMNSMIDEKAMTESIKNDDTLITFRVYENAENVQDTPK